MKNRSEYAEKFKDPRWQKKRLEVLERYGFECAHCGEKTKTLHVHHKIYIKGRDPWEYEEEILTCLCEDCHDSFHRLKDDINILFGKIYVSELTTVYGYLQALAMESDENFKAKFDDYESAMGFGHYWGIKAEVILKNMDHKKHQISWKKVDKLRGK